MKETIDTWIILALLSALIAICIGNLVVDLVLDWVLQRLDWSYEQVDQIQKKVDIVFALLGILPFLGFALLFWANGLYWGSLVPVFFIVALGYYIAQK